jgi:hypothetical protein
MLERVIQLQELGVLSLLAQYASLAPRVQRAAEQLNQRQAPRADRGTG